MVDRISDIIFCPTEHSLNNLKSEGLSNVGYFTGDIMYDIFNNSIGSFDYSHVPSGEYIVATIHRQENVDEKIHEIVSLLNTMNKEVNVILPIHPRTKNKINQLGINTDFTIIPPIGYLKMQGLLEKCKSVITDSGGLTKEAYFHKKECKCLLKNPVWPEITPLSQQPISNDENISGDGKSCDHMIDIIENYKYE